MKKLLNKRKHPKILYAVLLLAVISCQKNDNVTEVEQWATHEIRLESEKTYTNGYTDVDAWVQFINDAQDSLMRPAFWDGGNVWKVRFAPPDSGHTWTWSTHASVDDKGLAGNSGTLRSVGYKGENRLLKHGLLRMSPGKRNVVHADSSMPIIA